MTDDLLAPHAAQRLLQDMPELPAGHNPQARSAWRRARKKLEAVILRGEPARVTFTATEARQLRFPERRPS